MTLLWCWCLKKYSLLQARGLPTFCRSMTDCATPMMHNESSVLGCKETFFKRTHFASKNLKKPNRYWVIEVTHCTSWLHHPESLCLWWRAHVRPKDGSPRSGHPQFRGAWLKKYRIKFYVKLLPRTYIVLKNRKNHHWSPTPSGVLSKFLPKFISHFTIFFFSVENKINWFVAQSLSNKLPEYRYNKKFARDCAIQTW